jgi:hypothetical protein
MDYFSFNRYLQKKFGQRVQKISLDAGFDCPNLDGTLSRDGCIFCNNQAFSHFSKNHLPLMQQVRQSIDYMSHRYRVNKFIAYFQARSSTYADLKNLKQHYDIIRQFPQIVGLAISTRPDCIDREKLKLINSYGRDYEVYLEYGLQSANDVTLDKINRNHHWRQFREAVEMGVDYKNIKIAVHLILGLPQETKEDLLNTAGKISQLPLWGVKLHLLHVVKNTVLADIYKRGQLKLLSRREYVDWLVSFLEVIPPDWVILRLVPSADRELLIAPHWINNKQKVLSAINQEFQRRDTYQGVYY